MNFRTIHALAVLLSICGLGQSTFVHVPSCAQSKNSKRQESWQNKLYEEDVSYGNYACGHEDSELVETFFKEHPLNKNSSICHNDCPIIKCRPLIPFPSIAKTARVTGTISVHVLVDEKGRVLYARVLTGHPLLWAAARKGACETQFREYPYHKHQGVMHFTVEDYDYLGVPNRANEVL